MLLILGEPAVIVLAALLVGGFGWAWPGGLNLAVVQRSPEAPAWAVGVMMTGLFTGAVAGPLASGCSPSTTPSPPPWLLCAGLAVLSAVTVLATRRANGLST